MHECDRESLSFYVGVEICSVQELMPYSTYLPITKPGMGWQPILTCDVAKKQGAFISQMVDASLHLTDGETSIV